MRHLRPPSSTITEAGARAKKAYATAAARQPTENTTEAEYNRACRVFYESQKELVAMKTKLHRARAECDRLEKEMGAYE